MASLTSFGRKVVRSLREDGVVAAASFAAGALSWNARQELERLFDRRFGTDTTDLVDVETLDPGRQWTTPHIYEPTPLSIFRKMLRKVPEEPSNLTFVDVGSGKGLVLLAAAQRGFRRIVGVEISEKLCTVARENVEKLTPAGATIPAIEVICTDAAQFPIPEEKVLLYLHNPFGEPVIRQVARNIQQRLSATSTELYVLYYNPRFQKPLEEIPTARVRAAKRRVWALAARNRCGFVLYQMGRG